MPFRTNTLLLIGLLVIAGCDSSAPALAPQPVNIEEEFAPLFLIDLYQTPQELIEAFGQPTSLGFGDCACGDGYYETGPLAGLSFFLLEHHHQEGEVAYNEWHLSVLTANPPYGRYTRSGLGLGAMRAEVEALLGAPDLKNHRVDWRGVGGVGYRPFDGYTANDSIAYAVKYDEADTLILIEEVLLVFDVPTYNR